MKIIDYNAASGRLEEVLNRESDPGEDVRGRVLEIIDSVRKNGDQALIDYAKAFDGAALESLRVSPEEIEAARAAVGPELLGVYEQAAANIRDFHEKQLEETWTYSARPGVTLGQQITPIAQVGMYVPGGKAAYPSTVLMDAIPAAVAGVERLVMVTPPRPDGSIDPHILAAASVAGVDEIYKTGGAQAIAALAYGTESIAPVYKIVGPGNIYVATAKKEVFGRVDIDMIAGPSEVLVLADETANPEWVAADLLSQAEHDEMAMPVLVTTDRTLPEKVISAVERQIEEDLSRKEIARRAVEGYGFIFVCDTLEQAFELANAVAPEHMELCIRDAAAHIKDVKNAGAIFVGPYTPEPVGDYFAGPNHTLPTSGTARFSSPLGVYDYLKRSSILEYSKEAFEADAAMIEAFAGSEGLDAHAASIHKRVQS